MDKKGQYTEIYFLLFEVLMILVFAAAMFSWTTNAIGSEAFTRDYAAVDSSILLEFLQNPPGNFIFNYGGNQLIEYRYDSKGYNVCLKSVSAVNLGCDVFPLGLNNIQVSGAANNNNIVRFFKACSEIIIGDKGSPKSSSIEGYLDRC